MKIFIKLDSDWYKNLVVYKCLGMPITAMPIEISDEDFKLLWDCYDYIFKQYDINFKECYI